MMKEAMLLRSHPFIARFSPVLSIPGIVMLNMVQYVRGPKRLLLLNIYQVERGR
jgi:hypothetical protein